MNKEKLESMKGSELIAYADKLGVKVSCNKERTSLKESKSKVIDKILDFEKEHTSNNYIATEVEQFCNKNDLILRCATRKNIFYIKNTSKSIKIRITKKSYVCYKSGHHENGIFEEKSNRTKYVFTSLNDILNIL